jgi:hypothetical protein
MFGLGEGTHVEKAVISWPDGEKQVLENPAADQLHQIQETE